MERIEARISPSWTLRMIIAGLAFVGFGLWSLYDGKIRYPEVNRDYRSFLAGHLDQSPDSLRTVYDVGDPALQRLRERLQEFAPKWNEHWKSERRGWLAKRGWKDMDPSKVLHQEPAAAPGMRGKVYLTTAIHSEWDIRTQFIMAAICLPIGLYLLYRLVRMAPRRLAADEDTLYCIEGPEIPFESITSIDKKKWDRKGIAWVHYEQDGKNGKALIDDWIFKGAAAVLERIESVIDPPGEEQPGHPEEETTEIMPDEEADDDSAAGGG